jgi:hypothetical protein
MLSGIGKCHAVAYLNRRSPDAAFQPVASAKRAAIDFAVRNVIWFIAIRKLERTQVDKLPEQLLLRASLAGEMQAS